MKNKISIVNYQQLVQQCELRVDARYWREEYLQNEMLNQSSKTIKTCVEPMNNIAKISKSTPPPTNSST